MSILAIFQNAPLPSWPESAWSELVNLEWNLLLNVQRGPKNKNGSRGLPQRNSFLIQRIIRKERRVKRKIGGGAVLGNLSGVSERGCQAGIAKTRLIDLASWDAGNVCIMRVESSPAGLISGEIQTGNRKEILL